MSTSSTRRLCSVVAGPVPPDRGPADAAARHQALAADIAAPWSLRTRRASMVVRPARPSDLHRVATLHGRCWARSLLDRYRAGGRGPSPVALGLLLRRPLGFVATLPTGAVVAWATVGADALHGGAAAELGLLVADEWQGCGIGRRLVRHAAAAAAICGYTEVIGYPGTSPARAEALLAAVGAPRVAADMGGAHVHAFLPEVAALGLGSLRQQLAS